MVNVIIFVKHTLYVTDSENTSMSLLEDSVGNIDSQVDKQCQEIQRALHTLPK